MVARAFSMATAVVLMSSVAGSLAAQEPEITVTLQDAVALAVRVQPAMVQARGDLRTASASRREAIGNWMPTLSTNSTFARNSANRWDPNTQQVVSLGASNSYSAGLNASLELFDGFRRPAQNRAASANLDNADAQLVNQQFQIVLQTKQTFFSALAAQELVRVSQTRIQRADEQLKIAKDKLAAGSATRSDTLRATVELANARLQLLNAETQLSNSEANLARLIGFDRPVKAVSEPGLFEPWVFDEAAARQELLANAPSIAAAEASSRAAQAQVHVTRAQYFPSITASYNNAWSGAEIDQLANSWSARLQLSWSLFNGFTRETNVTRANAQADAARARADDARRQAQAQFTQFVANMRSAEARMSIANASRAAAEEDLRVQRERYRLGAATMVELLSSQVALDQAEVDLVTARLDFLIARAQIESLLGREL